MFLNLLTPKELSLDTTLSDQTRSLTCDRVVILRFTPPCHDITEIMFKVTLNNFSPTQRTGQQISDIQLNLSKPTHQGDREMCWIIQGVVILSFYFSKQKCFGTINFCWMSQDVGKLRCRIAQVPLYMFNIVFFSCFSGPSVGGS